ncbi:SRPBCC family protein [Crossiella sp. NPDC003009]
MTTEFTTVKADQFLAHPPAKVWRALTDPARLARWLMPNDFQPVVGHRFTFNRGEPLPAVRTDGIAHCEVLEIQPERLLRISFNDSSPDNGMHTTITWTLTPEGRGTRLFLVHDGFDPDNEFQQLSRKFMASGWSSGVAAALAKLLDEETG